MIKWSIIIIRMPLFGNIHHTSMMHNFHKRILGQDSNWTTYNLQNGAHDKRYTHSWSICSTLLIGNDGVGSGATAASGRRYVRNSESTKWPSPSTFDSVSQTTLDSRKNPWSVTRTKSSFYRLKQPMPATVKEKYISSFPHKDIVNMANINLIQQWSLYWQ